MRTMSEDLLQVNKDDHLRPGSDRSNASSASSTSSHRNKELLKSYHNLAAHIFNDGRSQDTEQQFLAAARDGNYQKVSEFLQRMSQEYINVDCKDQRTGNTPIIWATKRGHTKIVQLLLKYGADITLRNYDNETALDVASVSIRTILLDSVERTGCTPRHLLQAAWQGNVKVLKRVLSESKMLDINCRNADGYTPLLLVTRDIDLFEKIGRAAKNYNPVEVVAILVQKRSDVTASDPEGKSSIHLASSCKSPSSEKVVCLMLKDCPLVDSKDNRSFAPIHSASQSGQSDVVVALINKGADVNCRGFAGVTPLHVSAQSGHQKIAETLLERGADILLVDDSGNTAVEVAKTKKIKTRLKEAWAEATQTRRDSVVLSPVKPPSRASMVQQSLDDTVILSPTPAYNRKRLSEVVFDFDDLPVAEHPALRNISPGKKKMVKKLTDAEKSQRAEMKMMQDIESGRFTPRPNPRKFGMPRACSRCDSRNSMVITPIPFTPAPTEISAPQQTSPRTPEKMPLISPLASSSSPEKSNGRMMGDKRYKALNRSFEEDGVRNSKVRAHQRLAQKFSDPTRKSVPAEYGPVPVTVLGLELDDNLQEIRFQRVNQGPIGHMIEKKRGGPDIERSTSFHRTYPLQKQRSFSNPSVTDVTEACNSYLKRGKRLPRSLSNVENSDEIVAPPPKLAPMSQDNPRLKIPYTIEEGKPAVPMILDLDQMTVRVSADSPMNGSTLYPNSRSLLPPSPAFRSQVESIQHDPVLSFHAEDEEEEAGDTHRVAQSNGVSHGASEDIKLAVPDHLQLTRSKSLLDKHVMFNIMQSRVKAGSEQQQQQQLDAPLSSRSNESSSYSSSVSSLSTPSPRTSFDVCDPGLNLRKSGAQMTPAATGTLIIEKPVPLSQARKPGDQPTLVKTTVAAKSDGAQDSKKPSSSKVTLSRTYPLAASAREALGQNPRGASRHGSDSSHPSQETRKQSSKMIELNSSADRKEPVRKLSNEDSAVPPSQNAPVSAGQRSVAAASAQKARAPSQTSEPKSVQPSSQGKVAESNAAKNSSNVAKTNTNSASKQAHVTQSNNHSNAGTVPGCNLNPAKVKDSPQSQQKSDSSIKKEQAEPCQSAGTRLLFSRLSGSSDAKSNQTPAKTSPGKVELFHAPRNSISAGPKRHEPHKQTSAGNSHTPSPRKDLSSGNHNKTPVSATSKSAGAHLTRNAATGNRETQKSHEQKGKPVVAVKSAAAVSRESGTTLGQMNANLKEKVGAGNNQGNQALSKSAGNTSHPTAVPKKHPEQLQVTARVQSSAKPASANTSQSKEVLTTSKLNQTSKADEAAAQKVIASGSPQVKSRKDSEKENATTTRGKGPQEGTKPGSTPGVIEWGGAVEGKTKPIPQQVKSETVKKEPVTRTTGSAADQKVANKVDVKKADSSEQKPKSGVDVSRNIVKQEQVAAANRPVTSKPKTEELLRKAAEGQQAGGQEKKPEQSVDVTPVIYDMMESMQLHKEKTHMEKPKVEAVETRVVSAGRRNLLSASKPAQKRVASARDGRKGSATSRNPAKKVAVSSANPSQKQPSSAGKKKAGVKPGSGPKSRERGSGVEKPKSAKGRGKPRSGNRNADVVKKGKKGTAKIIKDEEIDKTAFITGMGWQIKTGRNENDDVIIHDRSRLDDDSSDDEAIESEDITPRVPVDGVILIPDEAQNFMPETMDTIKEFADTLKSNASEVDHDPRNMSINDKIINEIRRVIETEGCDRSPSTSWKINREKNSEGNRSNKSSRRSSVTQPIREEREPEKALDVPILAAPAGEGSKGLTPRLGFTDESDNEGSYMSDVSYETNPDLLRVFHVPEHFDSSEAESINEEDIEEAENMEDDVQFESNRIPEVPPASCLQPVFPESAVQPTVPEKKASENVVPGDKKSDSAKRDNTKLGSADKSRLGVPVKINPHHPKSEKTAVESNKKMEPRQEAVAPKQVPAKPPSGTKLNAETQEKNNQKSIIGSKPSPAAPAVAVVRKPDAVAQGQAEKEPAKVQSAGQVVPPSEAKKAQNRKPSSETPAKVVQKPPLPRKESTSDAKNQNAPASRKKSEKQENRTDVQENGKDARNDKARESGDDDVFSEPPGQNPELSPEQHAAKLSAENMEKLQQTLLLSQTQDDGDHTPAVKLQRPSHKEFESIDSLNSLASEFFSQSLKSDATDLSDRTLTETLGRPDSRTITSSLGKVRSAASSMRSDSASTMHADLHEDLIHWKKGQVLGRGAYGTVYCGLTNTGQLIAVKQVELSVKGKEDAEKQYEKLQEEVDLLKTLDHVNIVTFLGTCLENNTVNIFMQFVPGGSIAQLLARFGALEEPVFSRYTKQVLKGVDYLHENNVIHRDIKGGNVMLMPNGVIKLIDFGCAKRLCINLSQSQAQLLKSMRGTPYWMAPEVVMETGHGTKSDIWSVGCTVFEMATRKPPWSEMAPMAAIFAIGSGDKSLPKLPEKFSPEARNFVDVCMHRDQDLRPTARELLKHPFIFKRVEKSSMSNHSNGHRRRDSRDRNDIKEAK